MVAGGVVTGGLVGGGAGAAVGAGVGAGAGAEPGAGALGAAAGVAAAGFAPNAVAAVGAAAPVAPGVGGAPAAGIPGARTPAAAAAVGVEEPVGAVAAASDELPDAAPESAVDAGAPEARPATITNVAVALSPVARIRLADAGFGRRLVIEPVRLAPLLAGVLVRLGHAVVAPAAVVRRWAGRGRRGGRR